MNGTLSPAGLMATLIRFLGLCMIVVGAAWLIVRVPDIIKFFQVLPSYFDWRDTWRVYVPPVALLTCGCYFAFGGRWIIERLTNRPGFCTACGYDLRGVPEDRDQKTDVGRRCPECGSAHP